VTELANVLLLDVPLRPVLAEGGAVLRFVLNRGGVVKASHFKAKSLTTATSAKFEDCKTHVSRLELICGGAASG